MKKEVFFLEKFAETQHARKENMADFYAHPSVARIEPFKIADGLYYVGDKKVCIHLIDAGEGLILIDSGYLGTTHLLIDSVWRAGFDPKRVAWIIHTHGHSDHFGASDEFQRMFGTKLAISRVDAEALREKPKRAHIDSVSYPYAVIPNFDYEIEDGEIFEFGNVKLRFMLTPGHTQGTLSLFFTVTYEGRSYLAGMFGGAGVNALSLPYLAYNEYPKDASLQMLHSIDKLLCEEVVIHLGNHPSNNHTLEKREQQLREGGNPFIAPESWREFLIAHKEKVNAVIAQNAELENQFKSL